MLKRLKPRVRDDRGVGIVTALMAAMVLFALGASWYAISVHEIDESSLDRNRRTAVNSAEAGVRHAMYLLATNDKHGAAPIGFRTDAQNGGDADFGATAGSCDIESLTAADGDAAGEYWVRVSHVAGNSYLIESWGWGPAVGSRQAVNKKVSMELELIPIGNGFRHALFAASGGLQAGNRKEIYGDAYSGEDMTVQNFTRIYPNDAGHTGDGHLMVYGDLEISGGSNVEFAGDVYVNGYIRHLAAGGTYQGNVVTRYDHPTGSAWTDSYFKKATVNGILFTAGPLDPSSNVTGTVVIANNWAPFPGITMPTYTWDPADYSGFTPLIEHASWADFESWVTANSSNMRGVHHIPEGGVLNVQSNYFTDDMVVVVDGSVALEGTPSGADSTVAPVTFGVIQTDPGGEITMRLSSNSVPGQVHHMIWSAGSFNAAQQTTIYGSVYGNSDNSTNRLEVHFREPSSRVTSGFVWDPSLANLFLSQPGTWRETPTDDPVSLTTYCTP